MTSTFADLGCPPAVAATLLSHGFAVPFPIQAETLPDALAGRDVLGKGRTGSGKTLAFLLPVIARLTERRAQPGQPLAVVLVPTRELANQIADVARLFTATTGVRVATMFGGVPAGPQLAELRRGVELVVACPGRLLDHHGAGRLQLNAVEVMVVDEADHMADQGFLPMLRKILSAAPGDTQQLWFSATLDNGVDTLVTQHMSNPAVRSVRSPADSGKRTDHHVVAVADADRVSTVARLAGAVPRCVVFCRTKSRTKRLCRQLCALDVSAVELHGNLSQNARTRNLVAFANGDASVLVATDIAARGIHVDDVGLVVHADPPVEHKAYVHRSGRTGRAGASGTVVTVVTEETSSAADAVLRRAHLAPARHRGLSASLLATFTEPAAPVDTPAVHVQASRPAPGPGPWVLAECAAR